jgi:putative ABC transport system ATP-binding protein
MIHTINSKQNFYYFKNKRIMIKLSNLQKIYRTDEIETVALENVNLEVNKGDFLSIMGPSGCGKSTLLNIMGLLDAPTTGIVEIDGVSTVNMSDSEQAAFRNRQLGFVFQSFHLINSLNVLDNVELPLLYRSVPAAERRDTAKEVLEKVGLSHRMRHFPTQLSGGQCQRVAIARAIVGNPNIILADEPTGNLDSKMGAEVMEILHQLNREDGRTVVMVTHNEDQAKQTSRTIRFFDGRQISDMNLNANPDVR